MIYILACFCGNGRRKRMLCTNTRRIRLLNIVNMVLTFIFDDSLTDRHRC